MRLFSKTQSPVYFRQSGRYIVKSFVQFLMKEGAEIRVAEPTRVESRREKLRREYESYLRRDRGLSERSIADAWYLIARFLRYRFGDEAEDLSQITLVNITDFMRSLQVRKAPYRVTTVATSLRRFAQFLFKVGRTKTNLSLGIPRVAQRYGQRLPRHLLPEQVEAILAAVRSDTPIGRRNYAMVLLLARLGLRPPEVVSIQIEDIDWRSGEITVRGKGDLFDRVPLTEEVGKALATYIQQDRVTASRSLFVTDRAPHCPFEDATVLNAILKEAFNKIGIKPPVPYVGCNILRHSLATNLVQRGASLDEIANVMRHRSRATTLKYAKLDIEGLRSIALPWPVKGGVK